MIKNFIFNEQPSTKDEIIKEYVYVSKNKSHHKHYKGTQQIEENIYVIYETRKILEI